MIARAANDISIVIDYAADDSCMIQLWAKGHHPRDEFIAACEQALFTWDGRSVDLADVPIAHEHWRTVRADSETLERGVCDYVHIVSTPGRGAYEVTVLQTWLPLHTYFGKPIS